MKGKFFYGHIFSVNLKQQTDAILCPLQEVVCFGEKLVCCKLLQLLKPAGAYGEDPMYACARQGVHEYPFNGQNDSSELDQKGKLSRFSSGYALGSPPPTMLTTGMPYPSQAF